MATYQQAIDTVRGCLSEVDAMFQKAETVSEARTRRAQLEILGMLIVRLEDRPGRLDPSKVEMDAYKLGYNQAIERACDLIEDDVTMAMRALKVT